MRPRRPLGLSAAALALLAASCASEDPAREPPSLGSAALPLVEVSPEQDLDPPVLGSAWGAQTSAQVAFDGTQYLVVWEDRRSGFDGRVYAARVSANGVVLDPYGIEIGRGAEPSVAAGGGVFLVAYQTAAWLYPNGPPPTLSDVRAARIDAQGAVLDGGGFAISAGAQDERRPSVAFDGQHFLVAWDDTRSSPNASYHDVYHARISPDGVVLDPGGSLTALNTAMSGWLAPAVAASDQGFLVAWTDGRVYGTRVEGGVTLDPAGIPVGPAPAAGEGFVDLTATFDGTNYVMTWVRATSTFTVSEIQAGRVSLQGATLDAAPIVVVPDNGVRITGVSAAADGLGTLLLWRSGFGGTSDSVHRARLDPQGVVQPPGGQILATDAYSPAVAAAPNGAALAVWTDTSSDIEAQINPRLAGSRLDAQGTPLDDPSVTIATSANTQQSPAIAWDGQQFVVVWDDDRSYDVSERRRDVYGVRVAPGGAPLDPAGIPIGAAPGHQFLPAAVHTGQSTLVAWSNLLYFESETENYPGLHATRVSAQGTVLDPVPLEPGATVLGRMSAASNGAGALIGIPGYAESSVLPVDAAGAPGAPWFLPPSDPGFIDVRDVAIASDGVGYLAVATEIDAGLPSAVEGWLVDGQGAFTGVGPFPISPAGVEGSSAAAAFDGTHYVVLWTSAEGLLGTRVSPAGVVLDPQGFLIAPGAGGDELSAALACDGARCIAAWRERAVAEDPASLDILGAELMPDGSVSSPFTISAEPDAEGPPALAAGGGLVAVAYSRMRQGAPFGAVRAQLRWIGPVQGGGGGGAGGAPGTGGMGGQAAGGAGGAGGTGGTPEDPETDSGCDCATAPSGASAAPPWMALLGLGLWRLRRAARRRLSSRPRP